ncbi:MAG: ZIP family metal transporter [Solirubrobacteraceae bacterium]
MSSTEQPAPGRGRLGALDRAPAWALAIVPLVLIIGALSAFAAFGGSTLGERVGPAVEELAVERTVLRPGEIDLTVRNTGPDPVDIAQVFVNDAYVDFSTAAQRLGRLGTETLTLRYPWQQDSPYVVTMLTGTGVTIEHEIEAAVETPASNASFFGLMALIGLYIGVLPVVLGMLFLPLLRRLDGRWIRLAMAATVGLLGFLAVDGWLEGSEVAASSSGAFGGIELVVIGAALAYFALTAIDRYLLSRRDAAKAKGASGHRLALMVSIGIGLHNLGEGLAIGSAYAIGALALGAFLIIGFAIQNTTEGLAIVAPLSDERPSIGRLALLGVIAGAPAIAGTVIGAAAFNAELAALLIGVGVGAIVQVIQQLIPAMRDHTGRALYPASIGAILAGGAALYITGLIVA